MDCRSQLAPQRDDILRHIDTLRTMAAKSDPAAPKDYFIPRCVLARELTREKIKTLLAYENVRDVDCDTIHDRYLAVFGTLIRIHKIQHITSFTRYQEFADTHLPFHNHSLWSSECSVFFDEFKSAQWEFCAQELHFGRLDNVRLQSDRIIPIVKRSNLKRSPDSIVEVVVVHPDYNRLNSAATDNTKSANKFVLKSYDAKHESLYYNEINAYKRLKHAATASNIVQLHGSWKHKETYSILLEYVDGGTLGELFLEPPPTSYQDRLTLWWNLLRILDPVGLLHQHTDPDNPTQVTGGVHQDIKPANILVSKGNTDIPFEYTFKLGDMGLAYLNASTAHGARRRTKDGRGTQTYSAPECFRIERDLYDERRPDEANPSKDIWSLGCVFSLVLVWSVLGPHKLIAYQQSLHEATTRIPKLNKTAYLGCFHDGERMLHEVRLMHYEVIRASGKLDYIINDLVRIIEDMLDHDIKERPSANKVRRDCRSALERADGVLAMHPNAFPTTFLTRSELARQSGLQTELPVKPSGSGLGIDLTHQLRDAPATSSESVAYGMRGSHRPAGHRTPHNRNGSINAVMADSSSVQTPGSTGINDNTNGANMMSEYHNTPVTISSPTQHSSGRFRRNGETYSTRTSDHLQGENSTRTRLNHGEPTDGSPASAQAAQRRSRRIETQRPPDPKHEATIGEVYTWIQEKKKNKSFTHPIFDELLSECKERTLKNRDQIFLIDNSISMQHYRPEIRKAFEVLGYLVKRADPDGMELHFTNSVRNLRAKDRQPLLRLFDRTQHCGQGRLEQALSAILERCTKRSLASVFGLQGTVLDLKNVSGVNIYILTDGIWDGENHSLCGIDDAIGQTQKVAQMTTRNKIGIQFIQFGHNKTGTERLRVLDDGLKDKEMMDIIDHTHVEGNVFKMLRGSTDTFWDNQPASPNVIYESEDDIEDLTHRYKI